MPGSKLIRLEGCDVWVGPPTLPGLTVVRKVRVGESEPSELLEQVRDTVTGIGRRSARWWITPLSTPSDLAQILLSHSLTVESEAIMAMLAKCNSIAEGSTDIHVRPAETLEDYIACARISAAAFGNEPPADEAFREVIEQEKADDRVAQYMAEIDGRPVASARATFSPEGVALNGGGTLPEARGQGAYRALVAARCRDAENRGIDWAVVQARPSAAPILLRLGFEEVGLIQVLFDSW